MLGGGRLYIELITFKALGGLVRDQLQEIGERLKALREIEEITREKMADLCQISVGDYLSYENGERDFSFSFLYNASKALGVDVLELMSGDSPRLSTCCMVKRGGGFDVQRRAAYDYKHLAYTFRHKAAEPFLVTVEPDPGEPILHAHEGQEFNYVLEGQMTFFVGKITYDLSEGDSIYFDSGIPHAVKANQGAPCRFLAVVVHKEK